MSAGPAQEAELAQHRAAMRRAWAQGRRWYLRAILMGVIAWFSFWRGGGVYTAIGIAMVVLMTLSLSLGHSMRRQAAAMQEKLDLMGHMTSKKLGELSG